MAINRALFRKVKKIILAEPDKFDMETWADVIDVWLDDAADPVCQTTCCIGGHALLQSGYTLKGSSVFGGPSFVSPSSRRPIETRAHVMKVLGLTEDQTTVLDWTEWPPRFQRRFRRAKIGKAQAKVAADVIDAFLTDPALFVKQSDRVPEWED